MQPQGFMAQGNFTMPTQVHPVRTATSVVESRATTAGMVRAKASPATKTIPNTAKWTSANDPLGFDVFADFKKDNAARSNSIGTTNESNIDTTSEVGALLDISNDGHGTTNNGSFILSSCCLISCFHVKNRIDHYYHQISYRKMRLI